MPLPESPVIAATAAEYEAVFRAAPSGIVLVDAEGAIRDLNPAVERMFGYDRDQLLGQLIEILVPDHSRPVHQDQRENYLARPHARPMGIGMEMTGRRQDGSEFPVEISLSPVRIGGATHVIAVVHDVTERQQLRAFGAGALRAAEEERQRIARELHDDTAQRLAALLVRLELATRLEQPAARDALLDSVREGLQETADSVRRIARNLRPPELDEVGVVETIRAHARSVTEAYGLAIEVDCPRPAPRFAPDRELALYRIVQEALANVIRHAGATRARVTFTPADTGLEVEIVDNGCGFDPAGVERSGRGLGLLGMRERARHASGQLEIASAPGAGSRLRFHLPLQAQNG